MKKIKKIISLNEDSLALLNTTRRRYFNGNASDADIKQTLSKVDRTIPTLSGIFERALNLFYDKKIDKIIKNKELIIKKQTIYLHQISNQKYNELIVRHNCKAVDLINMIIKSIYA